MIELKKIYRDTRVQKFNCNYEVLPFAEVFGVHNRVSERNGLVEGNSLFYRANRWLIALCAAIFVVTGGDTFAGGYYLSFSLNFGGYLRTSNLLCPTTRAESISLLSSLFLFQPNDEKWKNGRPSFETLFLSPLVLDFSKFLSLIVPLSLEFSPRLFLTKNIVPILFQIIIKLSKCRIYISSDSRNTFSKFNISIVNFVTCFGTEICSSIIII